MEWEDIDEERLEAFGDKPYILLPKAEDEAWVVAPRFVPFQVGWLERQDDAWNVFVVNKYVDWITDLPEDIKDRVGIEPRFDRARVDDGVIEFADRDEREEAWDDLGGRDGGLSQREGDDKIKIKNGSEFQVIAEIIDRGNLPFTPHPVAEDDLRDDSSDVDLRSYQERAWEKFKETGMVGIYWSPGAGKTFVSLYAGDRIKGDKLVVVPSSTLEDQWEERIEEFCQHPGEWEVRTYQYITQHHIDDYQRKEFALTIFDECHHLPANTFSKLATINTTYRIGLSASPYREDERSVSADSDALIRVDGEVLRKRMEDIYDDYRSEDIEVLSFVNGEVTWEEANAVTRHEADETIYRVWTESGRSVDVTSDHSVMVLGDDFSLEDKRADELDEGDICLTPKSIPISDNKSAEQQKKWAYILGWYIADGSMVKNENGYWVSFSLNGEEEEKVLELKEALHEFTDHVGVNEDSGKAVKLVVSKKAFYERLAKYVDPSWDAHTKRVPQQVFDMSADEVAGFLRGYFQGDAGVTVNRELSSDILYLRSMAGRFSYRSFSRNEGEADFGTHTIDQSVMRYVVSESVGNSPFDRIPREMVDEALEEVLTEKRGRCHERVESVCRDTLKKIIGIEALNRIKLLRYAADDGVTVPEVSDKMDKTERTAQAYLRLQRDRGIIKKESPSGRGTPAVWVPTDVGERVLHRYRRLVNLLEGGFGFVSVKDVEEVEYEHDYVYDLNVPSSQTFIAGEGGLLCHNTDYIFALTGFPIGLKWQELIDLGVVQEPDVKVYLYSTDHRKTKDVAEIVNGKTGKILVFCDSIQKGKRIAGELDVPFVHGETRDRMDKFRDNRVVVASRVADEGLSLDDIDVVVEYDFHGGSRRQQAQRVGRVMHGESRGEHIVMMTDEEYEKHSRRLYSLEEQGFNIRVERRR